MAVCDFRDEVMKSLVALSCLSLLVTHLGESQLLCREDAQAVLGRGPYWEELRPPADSHVSEPSAEMTPPAPDKPLYDCSPG